MFQAARTASAKSLPSRPWQVWETANMSEWLKWSEQGQGLGWGWGTDRGSGGADGGGEGTQRTSPTPDHARWRRPASPAPGFLLLPFTFVSPSLLQTFSLWGLKPGDQMCVLECVCVCISALGSGWLCSFEPVCTYVCLRCWATLPT